MYTIATLSHYKYVFCARNSVKLSLAVHLQNDSHNWQQQLHKYKLVVYPPPTVKERERKKIVLSCYWSPSYSFPHHNLNYKCLHAENLQMTLVLLQRLVNEQLISCYCFQHPNACIFLSTAEQHDVSLCHHPLSSHDVCFTLYYGTISFSNLDFMNHYWLRL